MRIYRGKYVRVFIWSGIDAYEYRQENACNTEIPLGIVEGLCVVMRTFFSLKVIDVFRQVPCTTPKHARSWP